MSAQTPRPFTHVDLKMLLLIAAVEAQGFPVRHTTFPRRHLREGGMAKVLAPGDTRSVKKGELVGYERRDEEGPVVMARYTPLMSPSVIYFIGSPELIRSHIFVRNPDGSVTVDPDDLARSALLTSTVDTDKKDPQHGWWPAFRALAHLAFTEGLAVEARGDSWTLPADIALRRMPTKGGTH